MSTHAPLLPGLGGPQIPLAGPQTLLADTQNFLASGQTKNGWTEFLPILQDFVCAYTPWLTWVVLRSLWLALRPFKLALRP